MAVLTVTLPAGAIPVDGLQVSFKVPCECASFTHIEIDGNKYTLVDAVGTNMATRHGTWKSGAMLSVILDATNHTAYLQNGAAALGKVAFTTVGEGAGFASAWSENITKAHAGTCIIPASNTYDLTCVVDATFFETGDVLEFVRPYAKSMNIEFVNAPACYPGVISANSVDLTNQYDMARFVYNAELGCWIGSGNFF